MIIPNIKDRRKATDGLQAALNLSRETGDTVFLEGAYGVRDTLYVVGAKIQGTLKSFASNWTAADGSSVGPTTIYARHGKDVFNCSGDLEKGKTGRQPVICGLAIVGYGLSQGRVIDSSGIYVSMANTQPVFQDILMDAPGIGIRTCPGTCNIDATRIYIRSPRTGGFLFENNWTCGDSSFTGVYVNGKQRKDYDEPSAPLPSAKYGIKGLPNAGNWYGRTLIEECETGIITGVMLDHYMEHLKIEVKGVGIEVGPPYSDASLLSELHINDLQMRASFGPACVPWTCTNTSSRKSTIRLGAENYATFGAGAWRGSAPALRLRPAGTVFIR